MRHPKAKRLVALTGGWRCSYHSAMARRPEYQRGIKRGQIRDWPDGVGTPEEVAGRVTYTGDPVHKTYHSPAGPPAWRRTNRNAISMQRSTGLNCWRRFGGCQVSKSLSFDFDPIDQPAATDPAERQTWCSLGIRIGSRHVSRIWDKSLQSERTRLYVPAFPIAEWLVHNWWAILNELPRLEKVPQYAVDVRQMEWLSRHCLRSADSALLLPALSFP